LIIAWAAEHGLHPEDVYEDYLKRPRGYRQMWAWKAYQSEQQEEAMKKSRSQGG